MSKIILIKSKDNTMFSVEYNIVRSNRKTYSISLDEFGTILIRTPLYTTDYDVERIIVEKQYWITNHLIKLKERQRNKPVNNYTEAQYLAIKKRYIDAAKEYIPKRIAYFVSQYSSLIPNSYNRIAVRDQKTRWGSCSSNGTLSFNWRLMLAPPTILDYVIVHELCHLTHMNHSSEFWECVLKILPDYKERKKWLKEHGHELNIDSQCIELPN